MSCFDLKLYTMGVPCGSSMCIPEKRKGDKFPLGTGAEVIACLVRGHGGDVTTMKATYGYTRQVPTDCVFHTENACTFMGIL